jgi:hypothetical protein
MNTMRVLLAALLALAAAMAPAQTVYKYTDREGRVVYTDDPKAAGRGAQRVEENLSVTPAPPPAGAAAQTVSDQADQRAAALDRAVEDIAAATNDLRSAEDRRDRGVEPLEGERQGRRYRPEYWQRQQALQRDVDAARQRLESANARRNALR